MKYIKCLSPLLRQYFRTYTKSANVENAFKTTLNMDSQNQVHQESLRYIHPYARININTDIGVKVRAADVHEHTNMDVLIVKLCGNTEQQATPTKMDINISDDNRIVDLKLNNIADEPKNFHCELQVPMRAEINIKSKQTAEVSKIYSDEINVHAHGDIKVESLQARRIHLYSINGSIASKGLLLGKTTDIETRYKGCIELDKLQGDRLCCSSNEGDISIKSCYVDQSKFETKTGNLDLKNVHKKTEVIVNQEGNLNMSGVHGNMFVRSNGGSINLQLSELDGENIIIGDNIKSAHIHISDEIEENTHIEITSSPITLDKTLSHLGECLTAEKHTFELANSQESDQKLVVAIKGGVTLGKLSWADNLMETVLKKHDK